jgi:hypothetical protein
MESVYFYQGFVLRSEGLPVRRDQPPAPLQGRVASGPGMTPGRFHVAFGEALYPELSSAAVRPLPFGESAKHAKGPGAIGALSQRLCFLALHAFLDTLEHALQARFRIRGRALLGWTDNRAGTRRWSAAIENR